MSMENEIKRVIDNNKDGITNELLKGNDILIKSTPKGLKIQAMKISNIKK